MLRAFFCSIGRSTLGRIAGPALADDLETCRDTQAEAKAAAGGLRKGDCGRTG